MPYQRLWRVFKFLTKETYSEDVQKGPLHMTKDKGISQEVVKKTQLN